MESEHIRSLKGDMVGLYNIWPPADDDELTIGSDLLRQCIIGDVVDDICLNGLRTGDGLENSPLSTISEEKI